MPVDVFLALGSAVVCYSVASAFRWSGRCLAFVIGFVFCCSCDLLLAHAQMPWLRSRGVLYSAHSVCEGRLRVRVCRCLRIALGRPSTPHHIHSSHTTPRNIHAPHTLHTTHTTITPHTTRHSLLRKRKSEMVCSWQHIWDALRCVIKFNKSIQSSQVKTSYT